MVNEQEFIEDTFSDNKHYLNQNRNTFGYPKLNIFGVKFEWDKKLRRYIEMSNNNDYAENARFGQAIGKGLDILFKHETIKDQQEFLDFVFKCKNLIDLAWKEKNIRESQKGFKI